MGRPGFWEVAGAALGLLLIVEGLLPFASPPFWRRVFAYAVRLTDAQLRILGLASMLAGLVMMAVFLP